MLRVLDILMPIHAAHMARNQLVIGIDAQPVVIGFEDDVLVGNGT